MCLCCLYEHVPQDKNVTESNLNLSLPELDAIDLSRRKHMCVFGVLVFLILKSFWHHFTLYETFRLLLHRENLAHSYSLTLYTQRGNRLPWVLTARYWLSQESKCDYDTGSLRCSLLFQSKVCTSHSVILKTMTLYSVPSVAH